MPTAAFPCSSGCTCRKHRRLTPAEVENRRKAGRARQATLTAEQRSALGLKGAAATNAKRGPAVARTPTHHSWSEMLRRCHNEGRDTYEDYGGRGIWVDDRWLIFENFLRDMGERPAGKSIDRIDNDGPYAPWNCRWATPKEQAANRRPRRRKVVEGVR